MTRGGQKKDRRDGPERKCIVTGDSQPKFGLIRFVVAPDGQVVPDILGKLPGRGMYVSAERAALDAAGKGQFSRSAKQTVTVPEDLTGMAVFLASSDSDYILSQTYNVDGGQWMS